METADTQAITLISHSFAKNNGGIARVSRLMAKVLADLNIPTSLIELSGQGEETLFGFPKQSCNNSKRILLQTAREYSQHHSHFIFDAPNRARIVPWLWPRKPRVMAFCHGIEVWEQAETSWIQAAQRSDMLLCNSHYTQKRAIKNHPSLAGRLKVCPLATEEESEAQTTPLSAAKQSPVVIIVARMSSDERYKGHEELIHSWATVTQAIPDAQLKIIGSGDDIDHLKQKAQASPAHGQIHFLGKVSDEVLQQHYQEAMLFAMPSRNEGFGLVYIEAMRHALPVLVSKQDAGQELIEDGVSGIAVDLDQPDALTQQIIQALQAPERLHRIGLKGHERWKTRYTYPAFKDAFGQYINQFLALGS